MARDNNDQNASDHNTNTIFNQFAVAHWYALNDLQVCHNRLGKGLVGPLGDVCPSKKQAV